MSDEEAGEALVPPEDTTARGVVRYFRDCPDRFFAILGGIVFVAGWTAAIYLAFWADYGDPIGRPSAYKVQVLVSVGASVTTASAVLWGVAAYLWVHLLPDAADPEP